MKKFDSPSVRTFKKKWSLAITMLIALPCAYAQAPSCVHSEILNLQLLQTQGHATVSGELDGQAVQLLVDTGAQNTLLLLENLPRGVGSPVGGHREAFGVGGAARTLNLGVKSFRVGPVTLRQTTFPAIEGFAWISSAGILGSDFLLQADLELDYQTNTLRFHQQSGCSGNYLEGSSTVYRLEQAAASELRPIVTIEINGIGVRALIDSAATGTVVLLPFARSVGATPDITAPAQNIRGAGSQLRKAWQVEFSMLRVGAESWIKPTMTVMEAPSGSRTPYQVILGQDFIAARRILITKTPRAIFITPPVDGSLFSSAGNTAATPSSYP